MLFADYAMTRGPDIGEIYFIGPTVTGEGIYRSTDFGETAICMDSISEVESICADLTPGSLYHIRIPDCLYYSSNYGQYGSWVFRTAEGSYSLASGRAEGEIFKGVSISSNDYGVTFNQHSLNGCFCNVLQSYEIDNQDSIGYYLGSIWGINDTLWLFISNDNFDNLEIQHIFNWISVNNYSLSRGSEPGELYLLKFAFTGDGSRITELWYSSNFGENWIFKNHLLSNSIVGGRQLGEIYVLANYMQLMGQIAHTYIYHSLDFGETFTVYHPFSYGPSPYYANFEADTTNGNAPLTIQFTDLSSGDDIQNWEWDFNNDGVIDSYDQNPEYTYQDTGYYSVKLKIQYGPIEDGFIRTNYINITNVNECSNKINNIKKIQLNNYPNPFNPTTTIFFETMNLHENTRIEIYNIKGQKVRSINCHPELVEGYGNSNKYSVTWNGTDENNRPLSSGIYLYKLNIQNSPLKKMILLK